MTHLLKKIVKNFLIGRDDPFKDLVFHFCIVRFLLDFSFSMWFRQF